MNEKDERLWDHIILEDLPGDVIKFKNFEGREKPPYNPKGKRNFCVEIRDLELAKKLSEDGWYIRPGTEKEDGTSYPPHLTVQVKYQAEAIKPNPNVADPKVMMEQGANKIYLTPETIGDLDDLDILHVRGLEISPYNWVDKADGQNKVSAYLHSMRVEVVRDMFSD